MKEFLSEFPWIASKLHPHLNGDTPTELMTTGSSKKRWWMCSLGHSFSRTVANMIKSDGCPICLNRELLQGFNDLATTNPQLVPFFDVNLNGNKTASEVIANRSKSFAWKCSMGHVFKRRLAYMEVSSICPYCSGRILLEGYSGFGIEHPELLHYWDYEANGNLDPRYIHSAGNKKYHWRCGLRHQWLAPTSRLVNGSRCPFCSNNKVLTGFNDLLTLFPDVAQEWDVVGNEAIAESPLTVGAGSHIAPYWRCVRGHRWKAQIRSRTYQKSGCPQCVGIGRKVPKSRFAESQAAAISLWDVESNGFDLDSVTIGMEQKFNWKCSKGHSWQAAPYSIFLRPWCPTCKPQKSGDSPFPETIRRSWDSERNIYQIDDFQPASSKLAYWICDAGHRWERSIYQRMRSKGCPFCERKEVLVGFNDLSTTHPSISQQWSQKNLGLSPSQVVSGSSKKVWWECDYGHTWKTSVSERTGRLSGCPVCSGVRLEKGFNDLSTRYPQVAKEWHSSRNGDLKPDDILAHSVDQYWWKCSEDHEHDWSASAFARTKKLSGCPICAGKKVVKGINDFETRFPEIAKDWDYERNSPWRPDQIVRGASRMFWWICPDGHRFISTASNRVASLQRGAVGCPSCTAYGFQRSSSAILYFIENHEIGAKKIGIANSNSNRLSKFESCGWKVKQVWESSIGSIPLAVETEVLRWIRRELKLPPYLGEAEMEGMGGWSETFSSSGLSDTDLIAKINLTWSVFEEGAFFQKGE